MANWTQFFRDTGLINVQKEKEELERQQANDEKFRQALIAETKIINDRLLQTENAREEKRKAEARYLALLRREALDRNNKFLQGVYNMGLAAHNAIITAKQQAEEAQLQSEIDEERALYAQEAYDALKAAYRDERTLKNLTGNMKTVYENDLVLPLRAFNTKYPIQKNVDQESGWDRFANSVRRGWYYFVKWFKDTGWRILLELGASILIGCIPGIGFWLGMLLDTGVSVVLDILESAKTSAERVALQRAITEGRSRGLDPYEEMYMMRSIMVTLIVGVADMEGLTIDGRQMRRLMHSEREFVALVNDKQFLQDMWAVQAKVEEAVIGTDHNDEPRFELVPDDVAAAREMAKEMLDEGILSGLITGLKDNWGIYRFLH